MAKHCPNNTESPTNDSAVMAGWEGGRGDGRGRVNLAARCRLLEEETPLARRTQTKIYWMD